MRTYTKVLFTFFTLIIVFNLSAQPDGEKKKSSVEIIAQIYGRSGPSLIGGGNTSIALFGRSPISLFIAQRANPEIQVRYIKEMANDFSAYGGFAYGINFLTSSFSFISTSVLGSSVIDASDILFRQNTHRLSYGSAHLGARYTLDIKKNDALNVSFGGRGIYYPGQDLSLSQSGLTPKNGDEYSYNFENSSEDAMDNFVIGFELDINFQLGFKNSPLKFIVGFTIDRVTNPVRELDSELAFQNSRSIFTHSFGSGRVGAFLGASYAL